MKKIAFLFVCLISILLPLAIHAQDDYQIPESVPANNGELDWLVYEDRNAKITLGKKDVKLKSKNGGYTSCITYANIPLNGNGDFYLSATIKPSKVDADHPFGLVFNASSEYNYNAVLFDNQFCYIKGFIDRVRYKYPKNNKGVWKIAIERKNGGDCVVTLNGLEIRTIPKSVELNSLCVGAWTTHKGEVKILEVSYEQWAAPAENNE